MALLSPQERVNYALRRVPIFPVDITIEECREAVIGFPGFREIVRGDTVCFNYDFAFRDSFPDPNKAPDDKTAFLLKVRRECRGVIFDGRSGRIISRRYHKFHNVNELEETQQELIDLTQPHVCLVKEDGSLVAPLLVDGEVRFGSKAGMTELADRIERQFIPKMLTQGVDYSRFCREWLERDHTTIFEWCSEINQIVLAYKDDQLVLTAMRHNITGEYMPYQQMIEEARKFNVPVVRPFYIHEGPGAPAEYPTCAELNLKVHAMTGVEGVVLRFANGVMHKMKCDWYMQRAKKQSGAVRSWQEKNVWELVLDGKLDDVLASGEAGERSRRLQEFAAQLWINLESTAKRVHQEIVPLHAQQIAKKDFVAQTRARKDLDGVYQTLLFRAFDMQQPVTVEAILKYIVEYAKKNLGSSSALESIRQPLAGGAKFDAYA